MNQEANLHPTTESLICEIGERLKHLEQSLPTLIDPPRLSRAKMPFKALSYRETLIWRMVDLTRGSLSSFRATNLAAAIVLTRASVETSAALWYLSEKMEGAVAANELADLDDRLMSLSLGSKTNELLPNPINVLTFVKHVAKRLPEFEQQYDLLSEFAHPNWAGTSGLYARIDHENCLVEYGPRATESPGPIDIGLNNLVVALSMFELAYNRIADLMPAFVTLCEAALENKKRH